MYERRGFFPQEIPFRDMECPEIRFLVYSRGIQPQQAVWSGPLDDIFLGSSKAALVRGRQLYERLTGGGDGAPAGAS